MGIETKSLGFLIDQLITTSMRCWYAQEDIMNKSLTHEQRLAAAIKAQQQNAIRTELIRAIDIMTGNTEFTNTTKTYHTYLPEDKELNKSK